MCNLFAISIRYRTEAIFIPIASHEQDTHMALNFSTKHQSSF